MSAPKAQIALCSVYTSCWDQKVFKKTPNDVMQPVKSFLGAVVNTSIGKCLWPPSCISMASYFFCRRMFPWFEWLCPVPWARSKRDPGLTKTESYAAALNISVFLGAGLPGYAAPAALLAQTQERRVRS